MRTLKNNFRICQLDNKREFYKDKFGLERHGSNWSQAQQCQQQEVHKRRVMNNRQTTSKLQQAFTSKQESAMKTTSFTPTHWFTTNWQKHHQTHKWFQQAKQHLYQHQQQWTGQRIIGYKKDTCGSESTYNHAMSYTYHSRHNMDLTLQSSNLSESRSWIHKMVGKWQGLMINGQHKKEGWQTRHGQDQQTLRKKQHTRLNTSEMMKTHNKQHCQQEASRHHNNLQNKSAESTIWRIYHTDLGVQSVWKAKAEQTIIQHRRQAHFQSYNVTFHTSKAYMTNKSFQYLQQLTSRQEWALATMVQDKQKQFTYLTQCQQTFLTECGRTQAILAPTVLQSDQEEYLMSLLKTTARTIGSNITVRQSPAYSSQSQGSIERFHRTLFNQVRTLTAQLKSNYKLNNISINHPIMPWVIRHAAYLLDRYAIHNDGKTSCFRRWNKEHKTPLCEFGETIQYMVAHHKKMPKLESRFYKGMWLGKGTMTSESIIGITGKIIRTRTIRQTYWTRQVWQTIDRHHQCTTMDTNNTNRGVTANNDDTSQSSIHKATNNNRDTDNRWNNSAPTTTSRSKRIITARNNCWPANGNSTNKSYRETTTANAKETTTRWDYTRQWTQATKDNRTTTAVTTTTTHRTTSNKNENQCHWNQDKERWNNHHNYMWRPTRSWDRKNPSWTTGSQHRRIRQEEDNRRHEARSWTNEETRCLLWSEHQQSHTRTASNNHRIKMGVERQGWQSKSKNSSKGIHWTNRRCRYNLCKHTNILHTPYPSYKSNGQTMDGQSRRHFRRIPTCRCSNKRLVHVAPTRVLQWLLANSLEATQSNVRIEKLSASMAKSPSTNPTRSQHDTVCEKRAKRIQNKQWSSMHSCIRWLSTIHRTRQYRQWIVCSNSETTDAQTYRWASNGANNLRPRERHYKQRWSLRDQPQQGVHNNNARRSRNDNMQGSNNSRDGSKQDKQRRQWQHTRRQGRTCTLPTNRRKATMDDIHKTGLELCNKGTSKVITTTNILGHEENEAYTEIPTRNKGLQVLYYTQRQSPETKTHQHSTFTSTPIGQAAQQQGNPQRDLQSSTSDRQSISDQGHKQS